MGTGLSFPGLSQAGDNKYPALWAGQGSGPSVTRAAIKIDSLYTPPNIDHLMFQEQLDQFE